MPTSGQRNSVSSEERRAQAARNREIEQQIEADRLKQKKEVKLLLLGTGDSGKSTIIKQMTLIHGSGYTDDDRLAYKQIINSNLLSSIRTLLDAMQRLEIDLGNPSNAVHQDVVVDSIGSSMTDLDHQTIEPNVAHAIKMLWVDSGVQACFKRSSEFQLNDSAKYFLDDIDRITNPTYIPTDQDILRSRVKTTGIIETKFRVGDFTYRMFDVGGQRSERKKWIHCFENVTAVIFVVAISEYDQVLAEDGKTNRIHESLALFKEICNSKWFTSTSMILFMNKIDIFKTKLETIPIDKYIPEYEGQNTYGKASDYFKDRFESLCENKSKKVYTHFTCATDTTQVKFVMKAVKEIIIKAMLSNLGISDDPL